MSGALSLILCAVENDTFCEQEPATRSVSEGLGFEGLADTSGYTARSQE